MKKIIFILFATLAITSCDLLNKKESDSFSESVSDVVAPANDISISAIETTPSVKRGETITVDIVVTNSGTSTVDEEFEISLNNQSEGVVIGNKTLASSLAPNDSIRVSYSWDTENVTIGEQILVAKHTFKDDNAANDSLETTVTVSEPDIRDIAVSEVRLPNTIEEGKVVDVEVDVKNIGNQDVNEPITITLNNLTNGKTLSTHKIEGGFLKGDSTTFTYNWDTQGYPIGDYELSASHDFDDENTANDSRTASVTINEAPVTDIAVTSIEAPSKATKGDHVEVSVTVRNVGNKDTPKEFTVFLRDRTDNKQLASKTISGLDAENTVVFAFVWDTDQASIRDHTLEASHNFDDDNSANDSRNTSVTITEPSVSDIGVTSIDAPSDATQGDNVEVKINIENLGNRDVNDDITVTLVNQNNGARIDSKSISEGLDAGAEKSMTFKWDTDGVSQGKHTLIVSHDFDDENTANDSRTASVTINEAPVTDIAVTSIEVPSKATQGDHVEVSVTVRNVGNKDASGNITVILRDRTDNKQLASKTVSGLDAERSVVVTFVWDTDQASIGDHTLEASHEFDDENTANDSRTTSVTINEAPVTDIAVASIDAPSEAAQGDNVEVKMTIENRGNRDVDEAITITLVDQADGSTIDSKSISGGLDAGAEKSMTFKWDTEGASSGNHRLVARHNLDDDNSDNDSKSIEIRIIEEIFMDIAVTEIDAPDDVEEGDKVTIEVTLSNLGDSDVNENIRVTLVDQTDDKTISKKTKKGGLKIGSSKTLEFVWNIKGDVSEGDHTLIVSHDFADDNLDNNSRTFEIEVEEDDEDD